MASKHTAILRQIMIDWTEHQCGTLWTNPQIRVPMGGDKGWVRAGLGDGTADMIGVKQRFIGDRDVGIFAAVEIKTRGDWLKRSQRDFLSVVLEWGGCYYLGLEAPGCTVKIPRYRLWEVTTVDYLSEIRRQWNELWQVTDS